MKKKGFTLVELLAVISILAILVLISMPNIIEMYNNAKKRSFLNEVETVKSELKKETFNSSLNGEKIPEVYSSFGENKLDMDGRELEYYAEMNSNGTIKYLEITDGQYYYQCRENEECNSVSLKDEDPFIKMDFIKENVSTEKVFVYDTLYEIYDSSNAIPVIMTNVSNYDVKVKVSYNNVELKEFVVPGKINEEDEGTIDQIEFVYLEQSVINSLSLNNEYSLKIDTEVNLNKDTGDEVIAKYPYSDKVKFKRVKPEMIITGASSTLNNNKIAFNQTGIFVPKEINVGTLTVNVRNSSNSTYKFKNIFRDELKENVVGQINDKSYHSIEIVGNEYDKYQSYLNGGIYFYNNSNNSFTMDFAEKGNIQKIYFDFDVYINPGVYADGELTISSKENASSTKFGDFYPMSSTNANKFHGTHHCPLIDCFGNNKFNYAADGGLILNIGEGIPILDIAQSMGISNSYSVYTTVLPDTLNQEGLPTGEFPGTILAISQGYGIYLTWIGIYKNYLHVYSYHQGDSYEYTNYNDQKKGFISFDISEYEGKKMNIQVTSVRGGVTNVYINGVLKKTFNSGSTSVKYNVATIGDLRPTRGLRFQGRMYDMTLYNNALSSDAISHNWNYANKTWNIEK